MNNTGGKSWYGIGIDHTDLERDARKASNIINSIGDSIEVEGARLDNMMRNVGATAAGVFGAMKVESFVKDLVSVRSEFQNTEAMFKVFLGSAEKATQFTKNIQRYAFDNVFEFKDLNAQAAQLLSFRHEVENIIPIIDKLSNVAAGANKPLQDYVELYNRASQKEKLTQQDIDQWAVRGVNIIHQLSQALGKSEKDIKSMVSAGKVGFKELDTVLNHITSEGGLYYGMMAEKMKTLGDSVGLLQDSITAMFNEIGEASEDFLRGGLLGANFLVEHYKEIAEILGVLIATYGVLRTQQALVFAYDRSVEALRYREEATALESLITVEQKAVISKQNLTKGSVEYSTAVRNAALANVDSSQKTVAAMRMEIKALHASKVAAQERVAEAGKLVAARQAELVAAQNSNNVTQIAVAQRRLDNAVTEQNTAITQRNAAMKEFYSKKVVLQSAAQKSATLSTAADTAVQTANASSTNILSIAKMKLATVTKTLHRLVMSNPYALAAVGVTALVYGIYKLVTYTTEAEAAAKRLKKAHDDLTKSIGTEREEIDTYFGRLKGAKEGSEEYQAIKDIIVRKYGSYIEGLEKEIETLEGVESAYHKVSAAAEKAARSRAVESSITDAASAQKDIEKKNLDKIGEKFRKKFGTKDGNTLFGMLKYELERNTDFSQYPQQLQDAISKFDKEHNAKYFDHVKVQDAFISNPITEQIDNIRRSKAILNKEKEEIFDQLGDLADTAEETVIAPKIEIPKEKVAEIRKQIAELNQEIADLRSGKKESSDLDKDLDDKIQELKNLKSKLTLYTGEDDKSIKAAAKTDQEKADMLNRIANNAKSREFAERQAALDIEQLRLDLEKDSYEKQQKQIDLNHRKELLAIDRRGQEMIEKQQELERQQWEADGKKGLFTVKTTSVDQLSERDQQELSDRYAVNDQVQKAEMKKLHDELLKEFEDYQAQRERITKEFNDKIKALDEGRTAENALLTDRAIDEAIKQRDRALADLDTSMDDSTSLWAQLFDKYTHYTNQELEAIINNAREVLDYVNNTPESDLTAKFGLSSEQLRSLKNNASELGAAYDALRDKMDQFTKINPFATIVSSVQALKKNSQELKKAQDDLSKAQGNRDAVKAANERIKKLKEEEKFLEDNLKKAAITAMSYLGNIGDSFQQIGAAAGDAGIESFGKVLSDLSGIAESFMQGGPIAAGITAITTGLTAFFSSQAKYRAALKQMEKDQLAFAHDYKLAMSDIRLQALEATTVFGEDSFAKAIAALKEMHTMYEDFINLVNKDDTLQYGTGYFEHIRKLQNEAKGITTDLENIKIVTRHKTWFRSEKSKTLKELYPDLFRGEDGFDVEAARSLLNTNNQLNDYAKEQIQDVIDLYDQWQKAEEAFKDYLSQTFGEIGDSLGDAITSAFEDGTDAMENWADSFNNVLKNLGKQMMQTLYFDKYFQALQENMTEQYDIYGDDPNSLSTKVTELLGGFFSNMSGVVDEASEWYENFANEASKWGFDLKGDSDDSRREASSRGLTAASQDSVNETNGRLTVIQSHTYQINENVQLLVTNSNQILDHVINIDRNTEHCKRLENIEETMNAVKSELNTINMKGVKINGR